MPTRVNMLKNALPTRSASRRACALGWLSETRVHLDIVVDPQLRERLVQPDAGHGFINNLDPADATPWLIFLVKISGTRYHEPFALDASRRIAAFFARHLKS